MSHGEDVNAEFIVKKYYGSKTERLIETIGIDEIRDWNEIRKTLGFTEKELNFHLHLLYDEGSLTYVDSKYYIHPQVVEAYENIDWRELEDERQGRKVSREPTEDWLLNLPSLNPRAEGERKKRLRGE